jgi:hypothetical protein
MLAERFQPERKSGTDSGPVPYSTDPSRRGFAINPG